MEDLLLRFPALTERQAEQLKVFHVELLKFSKTLNLVSPTTINDIEKIHFADCLIAIQPILGVGPEVFDIGSGNGFPGIVLAIASPDQIVRMVESDRRKAEFLKHSAFKLGLTNAHVHNQRIESLGAGAISLAISRAFAPMNEAIPLVDRAFVEGGRYFQMKSASWDEELSKLSNQFAQRWKHKVVQTYAIPGDARTKYLICSEKIK